MEILGFFWIGNGIFKTTVFSITPMDNQNVCYSEKWNYANRISIITNFVGVMKLECHHAKHSLQEQQLIQKVKHKKSWTSKVMAHVSCLIVAKFCYLPNRRSFFKSCLFVIFNFSTQQVLAMFVYFEKSHITFNKFIFQQKWSKLSLHVGLAH